MTSPTLSAAPAADQLNKVYNSLAALKRDADYLKREISTGRTVWIGRAGYGYSSYAIFNCLRWNSQAGDYVCRLELNGDLPENWKDFFRTL